MFFLLSGVDNLNHTPDVRDPQNWIILIFGDLLTIQHLCSNLGRGIETLGP
ncbi:hypothetical protein K443DRAFT_672933, partial [Laccaria amethystina LaAM-08-1]